MDVDAASRYRDLYMVIDAENKRIIRCWAFEGEKMTLSQAIKKVKRQKIFAYVFGGVSFISLILGGLRDFYWSIKNGSTWNIPLFETVANFINWIYTKTTFLDFLWKHSPQVQVNLFNIYNIETIKLIGVFSIIFISMQVLFSAQHLSERIKNVIRKNEEKNWGNELSGNNQPNPSKNNYLLIPIELEKNDKWYARPIGLIAIGVLIMVIGQYINIKLGLH